MSATDSPSTSHERAKRALRQFCCGEEVSAEELHNALICLKFDYGGSLLEGLTDDEGKPLKKDSVAGKIREALSRTTVKIDRVAA